MTDFNAIMADDAANTFAGGEFSETVTYSPTTPTAENPERSISAVIVRNPPAPLKASPDYITPKMLVIVANDATLGIDSSLLDTGGDKITVAYRPGETPRAFSIQAPSSMDEAVLTLELR